MLDPFAGVCLGSLPCLLHGVNWLGCELEERFIELGRANLALWQRRYGHTPGYGQARLIQGDSRELYQVLEKADCVVSSPPYANSAKGGGPIDFTKALPHRGGGMPSDHATPGCQGWVPMGYGDSPAQLGNLPPAVSLTLLCRVRRMSIIQYAEGRPPGYR